MPAGTVKVKYVGGLDEVSVWCPTSGLNYHCAQGETIEVLPATAAGLSTSEWEFPTATKRNATKKDEA